MEHAVKGQHISTQRSLDVSGLCATISQDQHLPNTLPPIHHNKQVHSLTVLQSSMHKEEECAKIPDFKPVLLECSMAEQVEETRTFHQSDDRSSVITLTSSGVLQLWHAIGKWKRLASDTDIARFLLSLYFNSKTSPSTWSDSRCVHCSSYLTLCCLTCLFPAQAPAPPLSPVLEIPPQVISAYAQDARDQSHSSVISVCEMSESPRSMNNNESADDLADRSASRGNMNKNSSTISEAVEGSGMSPALLSMPSKNPLIFQVSGSAGQRQMKCQASQKLRSTTRSRTSHHISASDPPDQIHPKQRTSKQLQTGCKTKAKVSRKSVASKSSPDQIQVKCQTLQRLYPAIREIVSSEIDASDSESSPDQNQSAGVGKGVKKKRMSNDRLRIENIRSENREETNSVSESTENFSSSFLFMESQSQEKSTKEDSVTKNLCHVPNHDDSTSEDISPVQIKNESLGSKTSESQDSLSIGQKKQKDKYPICDGVPFTNGKMPTFRHFIEYKCSKCGKVFNYKHLCRRHMQSPECECVVCGEPFYDCGITEIRRHMKIHKEVKVKQMSLCPICGKSILGKKLAPHMKTHSEHRPYKCTMCNKSYKHKNGLQDHELKHREKKFQCETCGEYFFRTAELERHKTFKHHQQVYECEECGKRLSLKRTLENHILTVHRKFRPHVCSFCGLSHTSQSSLKVHLRSHTGEKPYSCQHCSVRFARLDYLKQHIRRHTGEKPFACQDCGKSFSCRNRLTLHRKNTHSDRLFPCNLCGEKFPLQSSLDFHRYNEHGGNHPLTIDQIPAATPDNSTADRETSEN